MRKTSLTSRIFFFTAATIPLLFGARHPLIQGLYTCVILLTGGSWLILNPEENRTLLLRRINIIPLLIIVFIFFTSLPLPFNLVQLISPVRADSLLNARVLAELNSTISSLSYYAPETRFYAVYLLALFCWYYFSIPLLQKNGNQTITLWIIMGVAFFEAIYGLLQAMNPSIGVLWLPSVIGAEGTARGTIIYRNQYAAFMNMCWPLAIVLGIRLYRPVLDKFALLKRKKKTPGLTDRLSLFFQKAALPFWAAAFMILAVIFSRSRGGIIVMLIIAGLLLLLLPFSRRAKSATGAAFLLFMLFYGGIIGFQQVTDRFLIIYEGAMGRILLWLDSLTMLTDHLYTGIGMGAYKRLSPVYLQNVPDTVWFDFAHNEYIELSIELGLPIMVLLLLWIGWGMVRYSRRIAQNLDDAGSVAAVSDNNILAIGAFCAIIGFLLHGLSDFIWRLPVNAVYAVILLAMLQASLASNANDEQSGPNGIH